MVQGQYFSILDLGSSQMRMLVTNGEDPAQVIAHYEVESEGVAHGAIIDLELAAKALNTLISVVQDQIEYKVSSVICTFSGESITSLNSHGVVKVRKQEVTAYDIGELVKTAQAVSLEKKTLIHVIPKSFKVDNQTGISDPTGMFGVRLEGDFHLIAADQGVCENIIRCLQKVGLSLEGFVYTPLGLAFSALSEDEKQQGVVIVDMGSGTTDCSVYLNGALEWSHSLPIGGDSITRDIAHCLKIDNITAEKVKLALSQDRNMDLDVVLDGGVLCSQVVSVIESRYAQIIKMIDRMLIKEGLRHRLARGYVFCGQAARYANLEEVFANNNITPFRKGQYAQEGAGALSQSWLGAIGLVYFYKNMMNADTPVANLQRKGKVSKFFDWLETYL
ncbi:cell division protein FtsA [Candidatus Comchoanobacter bicostacola]|uniref:Cell division protein FtsA n=1 Tax=Candidatus Comchoanobacter bicostacola TaxID=2919598 RepID=A0ABY5DKD2_9GAMM|nr:cell division protein FtsA [Candidatus Comchoanobacter bicostacola]UTC24726.1 cell division protein FtsA [Candidatus Comchoanobacter bicostacola]